MIRHHHPRSRFCQQHPANQGGEPLQPPRTLKPYKQDIYDAAGRIVTTVLYSNYQHYGDIDFPAQIDISRPFDEYALKITITKLTPNETLDDEQFHLEIPAGMTIQNMD